MGPAPKLSDKPRDSSRQAEREGLRGRAMTHLPSKGGVSGAVGAGCRGKRPRDEAQEVDEIGKIVLEMAEEEEGGRKEG